MTEEEWLECDDPARMLEFLRGKVNERKGWLIGVACCRRIWHLLTDERSRQAVEGAEQFAEGANDTDSLRAVAKRAWDAETAACANLIAALSGETEGPPALGASEAARTAAWLADGVWRQAYSHASLAVAAAVSKEDRDRVQQEETTQQAALLRHFIGNPFRPYPAPDHWPSNVVQLANALYNGEDCGFALHDALLEAGHPELADHFHQEQSHPKGCWVVDLLLGKG